MIESGGRRPPWPAEARRSPRLGAAAATVRLIQAAAAVLPGQTRRGLTALPDVRPARPFMFVINGGGS